MNIAFDPWIPVVTTTGERRLASLCSILAEGERYADLAVRPHERVSLMRLLLCVAHAALDGPKDYDEWREVPERLPASAPGYLDIWRDSFELFHAHRPWLQMAELSRSADKTQNDLRNWTPVSKLTFSLATGNNTTLFDHAGMSDVRNVELSETILSMLSFQCFSPGGLISQVYWDGRQTGKSSKDAPCVPASMIHAFLRGETVQKTIHLNLPTYEDVRLNYGQRPIGQPVWEMMPASPSDKGGIDNATKTYLGRLVPMTRVIRLHSSGQRMLLGDGLVYPPFAEGFPPEPTATVIIKENGANEERAILSYRPAKALWRELSAIVVKRKAEGTGGPLCLQALQDGEGCDLVVAALARDQATIVDTTESVFHIPSRLRTPLGTTTYEAEVKTAEGVAGRLGWAIETYRKAIDEGWEGRLKAAPNKGELKTKLHSLAATRYWTTVEKNLPLLMAHVGAIGSEKAMPTREAWRKMLFASACAAYRVACGQETPRQMRAFAKGWRNLTAKQDATESDTDTNREVKA